MTQDKTVKWGIIFKGLEDDRNTAITRLNEILKQSPELSGAIFITPITRLY